MSATGRRPIRAAWNQSTLIRSVKAAAARAAGRPRQAATRPSMPWRASSLLVAKEPLVISSTSRSCGESTRAMNSWQKAGSCIGSPPPDSTAFHRPMPLTNSMVRSTSSAMRWRGMLSEDRGEAKLQCAQPTAQSSVGHT